MGKQSYITKYIPNTVAMAVFCLSICLSTVFIKQHSVLDGLAAIPLCIISGLLVPGGTNRAQKRPL
ncbi:MAG: hypothetical protein IJC24_03465 [Clostridia bacterium]|nr:hypothetical protein [Clostridia bacterium]